MRSQRHENNMRLVKRYTSKGINPHLTWIYERYGRYAGIDRNFDVLGNNYYCFDARLVNGKVQETGHGEGSETLWYPSLEAARRVVQNTSTVKYHVFLGGGKQ